MNCDDQLITWKINWSNILWICLMMESQKCTLKQYQPLIGKLQWVTAVITPGRPFIRRLIDRTLGVTKPHYFIRVTDEVSKDLTVWITFFQSHNGKTFFRPRHVETSLSLNLFTDASSHVAAGVFGSSWFRFGYPAAWADYNITFLEMFPILVALEVFSEHFKNTSVVFHTDNQAITFVLKSRQARR